MRRFRTFCGHDRTALSPPSGGMRRRKAVGSITSGSYWQPSPRNGLSYSDATAFNSISASPAPSSRAR
jgi:hypothetical protein